MYLKLNCEGGKSIFCIGGYVVLARNKYERTVNDLAPFGSSGGCLELLKLIAN